jgi:hypothetical protein
MLDVGEVDADTQSRRVGGFSSDGAQLLLKLRWPWK